jgi:hypothetical protein
MVVISTRYLGIPTEGTPGGTWTARFTGFPLAGGTHAARYVRFALGGELAFRAAPHDRLDPIAWALVDLGFQYPFRTVTLFATGLVTAGFVERYRFEHGTFDFAWQFGGEIGIDLRPPRSPVGLELAGGLGCTGLGGQVTLNSWVRFGLAFF